MEARGLLSAEWGQTDTGRRARFYQMTKAGRTQLREEIASWTRLTAAVQGVLES
jgi:DNA-binding PadR family transcriptional regulator